MRRLKVSQAEAGQRADIFVANNYPDFTRSSLEGLFKDHKITISKKLVKESYRIKGGDRLVIDDGLLFKKPRSIKLPVIYEDEDVLVIDKPAGILTHSKGALNTEATVASFIRPKVNKEITGNRAGIVHRLDRATSGVIITAKNPAALRWLQKQFSARKTKKTYIAVLEGAPNPRAAIVDAPIARNPKRPQTFQVNKQGKSARTEYNVLKILEKNSLVELRPLTGRTHQIRIHMAYINHPVIGDNLYGHPGPKLALHAKQLELTLPNRERMTFNSEPPMDFKELVK
jgi:23S rRNA pseudouridine1911/1915/1917 synthase